MTSVTHCDYCNTEKREPNMGGWTCLEARTSFHEGGAAIQRIVFDLCRECTLRADDLRMTVKRGLAEAPRSK